MNFLKLHDLDFDDKWNKIKGKEIWIKPEHIRFVQRTSSGENTSIGMFDRFVLEVWEPVEEVMEILQNDYK